jgi:signal transduction histidine kinase
MSDHDQKRSGEIERLRALESSAHHDLQALVELAAQVCAVPKAAINLVTRDAQHQLATTGFEPGICARGDSMCAAVLDQEMSVVVEDASCDSRFACNPFVTGELGDVRFYASTPLATRTGVHIGRLCVFDDVPRSGLSAPEALPLLADRVVDLLELRVQKLELERTVCELAKTREELDRSNASLSAFAEQVSHDLRNPLTALITSLEVAQQDPGHEADAMLTNALRSGERMSELIGRLLDTARVGAHREAQPIDLVDLMAQVVVDLENIIGGDTAVHLTTPSLTISGDRPLLHAVLVNLVSNAAKFTRPHRPPVISVGAAATAQGWRIRVDDNGPGIAVEDRERVLGLHARLDTSIDGEGIGLASVRRMVTAQGGDLHLGVSPSGGLSVRIDLPRTEDQAPVNVGFSPAVNARTPSRKSAEL